MWRNQWRRVHSLPAYSLSGERRTEPSNSPPAPDVAVVAPPQTRLPTHRGGLQTNGDLATGSRKRPAGRKRAQTRARFPARPPRPVLLPNKKKATFSSG
ncbi:UNVERIFIED_CONTAM: hypothetical protein Sradi_0848200 [Sesamum radiatum]|uniref:Uncharacterized protein n=1 Tax=Sesamum radiatum TaxID=300843 RepID=A0AAW2V2P6_SESRA